MNHASLRTLLEQVASGKVGISDAADTLMHLPYENIDYAHIDHQRSLRKGFPEVIYGQGKTTEQIVGIMDRMKSRENVILVTRIAEPKARDILLRFPEAVHHEDASMIVWEKQKAPIQGRGTILVISAGTSDIPVAREAYLTAAAMGNRVESIFDVGVAGIHRLFAYRERIQKAKVLVVVAGMEGALPSVVAGLVRSPVIAVPTSVGYGTSLGGLAALLAMLNSCSSNVAVVNIDNGFGAGYMASVINRQ